MVARAIYDRIFGRPIAVSHAPGYPTGNQHNSAATRSGGDLSEWRE
jgi:hypothetical protein